MTGKKRSQNAVQRTVHVTITERREQKMDVDESELKTGQANIKVFGVGGGGGNAANWLYLKGIEGAEVIIANTDKQHLDLVEADRKFLLGKDLTRGLGAG